MYLSVNNHTNQGLFSFQPLIYQKHKKTHNTLNSNKYKFTLFPPIQRNMPHEASTRFLMSSLTWNHLYHLRSFHILKHETPTTSVLCGLVATL